MKRICICGGGNLGHVVAGFLAANGCEVTLLTRHPERWSHTLHITTPEGTTLEGHLSTISSTASDVVPQADMLLLAQPGFAIRSVLTARRSPPRHPRGKYRQQHRFLFRSHVTSSFHHSPFWFSACALHRPY